MQSLENEHTDDQTPNKLVEAFINLNCAKIDIETLATKIHDLSKHQKCSYMSLKAGYSRKTQNFMCKQHRTNFHCNASVQYYYDPEKNGLSRNDEQCAYSSD